MPIDNVYTQSQIQEHWDEYLTTYCWKIIKQGGQKAIRMTAPDPNAEGLVDCRLVKMSKAMGFPRYLELINGG
jgi:hypothetical protein